MDIPPMKRKADLQQPDRPEEKRQTRGDSPKLESLINDPTNSNQTPESMDLLKPIGVIEYVDYVFPQDEPKLEPVEKEVTQDEHVQPLLRALLCQEKPDANPALNFPSSLNSDPGPLLTRSTLADKSSQTPEELGIKKEICSECDPLVLKVESDNDLKNDVDLGINEDTIAVPSTSGQQSSIGLNKLSFENSSNEIGDDNTSDEDDGLEDEAPNDGASLRTLQFVPRNASAEPAADNNMSAFQDALNAEDQINDLAIREMVPSGDCLDFDWTKNKNSFTGTREIFDRPFGPEFPVTKTTSIIDVFYKMIDNDFIDLLCYQTNLYASQKIARLKKSNKLPKNSRLHRWFPTDRDEMISFLALGILQGLYPLQQEEAYFSFNGFGTMPYFSKIMSFNRYLLLKSLLHFTDNEKITEPSKLTKIQPVIDYFNNKFSSLYYPSQEIVIDIALLKWYGKLEFAHHFFIYNPTRNQEVGMRTFELCEASSGYVWKFKVYTGRDNPRKTKNDENSDDSDTDDSDSSDEINKNKGKTTRRRTKATLAPAKLDIRPINPTAKTIYELVKPLLNRGHTLIMNNFCNCPLLLRCLKRQKTDCFGTLRLNREFVPNALRFLKQQDLRQGEVVARYCSDLSVMVWREAKLLSMISTMHRLQIGSKKKCEIIKHKPKIVQDYNKAMVGVDRKDHYLHNQPLERLGNRVWYKKLFRRLFSTAIFNCFIIYNTVHTNISHRKFRILLAETLLKVHRQIDLTAESRVLTRRSRNNLIIPVTTKPTASRPKLEHRHFPVQTGFKQSRCWLCAQKKVQTRTSWKCLECDLNLCIETCFIEYHT